MSGLMGGGTLAIDMQNLDSNAGNYRKEVSLPPMN